MSSNRRALREVANADMNMGNVSAFLSAKVKDGASAREVAQLVVTSCFEIDKALTPIIGQRGLQALLKRSLHLACATQAWLAVGAEAFDLKAELMVSGDPNQLGQALSNLLSNASKYTRNHAVIVLRVEVTPRDLTLTVSDTGIGISAAILPKVFDPFVQDTHAIGFNGVGLGIGLTAVREVIEAHHGSVEARSAGEGQGSQFIVTLPRLIAL
jgi:signal transduction histidine kinase